MSAFQPSEQWLSNILDTIDEGIHAVDMDGVTIVYNAASGRMDGLAPTDVIAKHVLSVFPSLRQDTSTLLHVLRTGQAIYNQPQTYTNVYGVKVHTVNTTLPIVSEGRIVGAVEVAKDLTQVKNLAEQVIALQAQVVGGAKKRGSQTAVQHGSAAVYQFANILTQDARMIATKQQAERAARTSSPVLVYGETGTGKELLVQSIHNASPRAAAPFMALNCAALPASLLEGILFGTVKGSFTGAEDRPGLFELADGGTVFLDEIQSMPLDLQAKLLRVLQEGEMMRVGDMRVRRLNVRVIGAMNQRPEHAVETGQLRKDLYYRVNVVRLDIPPLRDRPGDVPLLVQHFLDKWNSRFGNSVSGVAPEVMGLFRTYPWPGNVRELQNVIEAALNLVSTGDITVDVLPAQIQDWLDARAEQMGVGRDHAGPISSAGGAAGGAAGGFADAGTRADERHSSGPGGARVTVGTSAEKSADVLAVRPDGAESSPQPSWPTLLSDAGMDEFWSGLDQHQTTDVAWRDMQYAFERIVLEKAMLATQNNVKQTARKLGIPRQTLQYRLKQLHLI